MKILLRVNLGSREFPDFPFMEGETHIVSKDLGELLIRRGFALEVVTTPDQAKVKGVAKAPAIAKATKPVIAESKDNASE